MSKSVVIGVPVGALFGIAESFTSRDDPDTTYRRVYYPILNDFEQDFEQLVAAIETVAENRSIEAIGLTIAGQVSPDGSGIGLTGSLTDWSFKPVAQLLETRFSCVVRLANDAEGDALAEVVFGRAPAGKHLYIKATTGTGFCFVDRTGEQLVTSTSELGHMTVNYLATDTQCGCGHPGCFESYVGGWSLKRFGRDIHDLSPENWEELIGLWVIGLYNAVKASWVQTIVIGGDMSHLLEPHISEIERRLRARLGVLRPEQLIVRLADEELSGGTKGALALLSTV